MVAEQHSRSHGTGDNQEQHRHDIAGDIEVAPAGCHGPSVPDVVAQSQQASCEGHDRHKSSHPARSSLPADYSAVSLSYVDSADKQVGELHHLNSSGTPSAPSRRNHREMRGGVHDVGILL